MSSTSGDNDGRKRGSMLNLMSSASSGDVRRKLDMVLKAMASILGIDNNRKISNGCGSSSVEEADQGGNRKMRKGRRSSTMEEADKGGEVSLKKGTWTEAEDAILKEYVEKHGERNWNAVQKNSGLARCGKSCRLRWANHLRPDLKKGAFTKEEEQQIVELHAIMGNKWSQMAAKLPGRTDNEIKNFWNTRIKRMQRAGLATYPDKTEIYRQQVSNGNQENLSLDTLTNEANQHVNISLTENFDIPDVSDMVTHLDQSTYASLYNMLPMMHPSKLFQLQGSDMIYNSFDQYDTSDPRLLSRYHPIVNTSDQFGNDLTGSHADLNGNISASSDPIYGAFKVELPSFQYFEAQKRIWATSESSLPPLIEAVDTPESSIQFQPNQSLPDSFQYFEAQKRIWAMPESSLPPLIEAVDTPESSIQFQPNHHQNNDGLLEPVLYGFKNLNGSNNVGSFQENNVDSFQENNDHCILNEEVLRSSLGPFAASVQWDEPEALRSSLGPFAASVQSDEPETLRSTLGLFAASVQSDEPEALRSSSLGPFAASVQADYTNITNCMYSMETLEDAGDKKHGALTEFPDDSSNQEDLNLIEFLLDPDPAPDLSFMDNIYFNGYS